MSKVYAYEAMEVAFDDLVVTFRFSKDEPQKATVEFEGAGTLLRADLVNEAMKAFADRYPFAFEETKESET
jgi:hypothetical protein